MIQADIDLIKATCTMVLDACKFFESAGIPLPGQFQLVKQKAKEMLSKLESGEEVPQEEIEQLTSQFTALSQMDINNN